MNPYRSCKSGKILHLALKATLESRQIEDLFCAGQFNGSSGYEEAAVQGFVAGVNAALKLQGKDPMIITRDMGYIGALIDDLVTKGTNEPYRMMTSRSEYRLLHRQDNADQRLSGIGRRIGLVSEEQYLTVQKKTARSKRRSAVWSIRTSVRLRNCRHLRNPEALPCPAPV